MPPVFVFKCAKFVPKNIQDRLAPSAQQESIPSHLKLNKISS